MAEETFREEVGRRRREALRQLWERANDQATPEAERIKLLLFFADYTP